MDQRKKGARTFRDFMTSVSEATGFVKCSDQLIPLEPILDGAREIPFESLNGQLVRHFVSQFFERSSLMIMSGMVVE